MRRYSADKPKKRIRKGDPQRCVLNQAKVGFPFRADAKLNVGRIVTDLEVDDSSAVPFLSMRYPVEDGTLQQKLIAQREAWYQEKLDFSSELAAEWTTDEFTAFFGTQEKLVNRSDPIDIILRLIDHWNTTNFDANFVATIKQDTKASFLIVS